MDGAEASLRAELETARRRLAEVPAAEVVANHAMGLFELAAIHLGTSPPTSTRRRWRSTRWVRWSTASATGWGRRRPLLRAALEQIRLAFVQVKQGAVTSAP